MPAMDWTPASAKERLDELFSLALTEGPQRIRWGSRSVMVMAEDDYERLTSGRPGFKAYLMGGPDLNGLNLDRDRSAL
ncbi:MAG: type II toxin-antitoxin system prevent-host-death family antitoxin [Nitrospirota bacterium]|nr:type II toxin-antitoxin system prevent-host-death family antitoxin [Nitrospirota bacterium]